MLAAPPSTPAAHPSGSAWEQTVDIARVPPGVHELVVSVPGADDGPHTDTRGVVR